MQPLSNYFRFVANKTGLIISIVTVLILTTWLFGPSPTTTVETLKGLAPSGMMAPPTPKHWPGWKGIEHMIVFGDSYTSTGFKANRAPPSYENPMGNPVYPGDTSSNGPNWINFLTSTYNQTFVKTVNFAFGGATVDGDLIRQYLPMVHSMKRQVYEDYLPNYCPPPVTFDWEMDNTLVATYFGINDVNNAWQDETADVVLEQDIAEYADLVDVIYQSGAKNFLFMLVPPFDRSPLVLGKGEKAMKEEGQLINDFNANITKMAANFSSTYPDVTTFVFDTHAVYTQVLDDPCAHPETCDLQNTTATCKEYEQGTQDWYAFAEPCSISVDRYFWVNPLHPTFRIQNVTAKAVAEELCGNDINDAYDPTDGEGLASVAPEPSANPYRRL